MNELSGKKVAILVADGFEQVEMTEPRKALNEAGAITELISLKTGRVKGWEHTQWGKEFDVDLSLSDANPDDYDALLLPGGEKSPAALRQDRAAIAFVRSFMESHKPIAAICHGPWLLIDTDMIRGRELTSYESIQDDFKKAGAKWVDRPVVVDNGLVTSRKPDDIPQFNAKMIEEFAEGIHDRMKPEAHTQAYQD